LFVFRMQCASLCIDQIEDFLQLVQKPAKLLPLSPAETFAWEEIFAPNSCIHSFYRYLYSPLCAWPRTKFWGQGSEYSKHGFCSLDGRTEEARDTDQKTGEYSTAWTALGRKYLLSWEYVIGLLTQSWRKQG
jgi:hypothetical protein